MISSFWGMNVELPFQHNSIGFVIMIFIAVIKSRAEKGTKLALMLALQGTACYLFLPAMHERYWVPVAGVLIIALTLCKNYRMCLYGFGIDV